MVVRAGTDQEETESSYKYFLVCHDNLVTMSFFFNLQSILHLQFLHAFFSTCFFPFFSFDMSCFLLLLLLLLSLLSLLWSLL